MKQILIAVSFLLAAGGAVAHVANKQLEKDDRAFVERGGKIVGCESLRYDGGIVCVKSEIR